jgi:hypothetical protein
MRVWAAASVPIVVLVLVVAVGVLGKSSGPPPSASRSVAAESSPATPASSSAESAPTPSPTPIVGGICTPSPIKFDPKAAIDLTGAWAGDDGGIYYVRQRGTVIWWNGMSSRDAPPASLGLAWNNVGRGEIKGDLTITSDWVDVPRGGIGGYGTVDFKIGPDSAGNVQITKTSETGTGRGDAVWTRCTPGFPERP